MNINLKLIFWKEENIWIWASMKQPPQKFNITVKENHHVYGIYRKKLGISRIRHGFIHHLPLLCESSCSVGSSSWISNYLVVEPTHLKKYARQNGSFPQGLGWKIQNIFELPPPQNLVALFKTSFELLACRLTWLTVLQAGQQLLGSVGKRWLLDRFFRSWGKAKEGRLNVCFAWFLWAKKMRPKFVVLRLWWWEVVSSHGKCNKSLVTLLFYTVNCILNISP